MTLQELSLGFDQLYNNIASNISPGLNAYEKSVFLTMAQEQVVMSFYSNGFESNESARRALDPLLKRYSCDPEEGESFVKGCRLFTCVQPDDVWYRIFESAVADGESFSCEGGAKRLDVLVTDYDSLVRNARDPFRGAWDRRVLRCDKDGQTVELFSPYTIVSYMLGYLRKPRPIIVEDLPDGLTVGNESEARGCEIGEHLHNLILTTAVQLAKTSWAVSSQSNAS